MESRIQNILCSAKLGDILADSGVADTVANAILRRASRKALPWAMTGVAFIIGIPMFFEVSLVVLLPLVAGVARKLEAEEQGSGSADVYVGVPVIAALAVMHGMVPPHPGPLTAISTLNTSVGATMIYGFIAAVPAIVLPGPVYGTFIAPRMTVRPDAALIAQYAPDTANLAASLQTSTPGLGLGVLAALAPALLMLLNAVGETLLPKGSTLLQVASFVGNPIIAMLLGVIFAVLTLSAGRPEAVRKALSESIKPIANVLLIIAGGGAFRRC